MNDAIQPPHHGTDTVSPHESQNPSRRSSDCKSTDLVDKLAAVARRTYPADPRRSSNDPLDFPCTPCQATAIHFKPTRDPPSRAEIGSRALSPSQPKRRAGLSPLPSPPYHPPQPPWIETSRRKRFNLQPKRAQQQQPREHLHPAHRTCGPPPCTKNIQNFQYKSIQSFQRHTQPLLFPTRS